MKVDIDKLLEELDSPDSLEHYGVLGMRWGVRKDRRTGKRVGKPVEGTKAATRATPSVSPDGGPTSAGKKKKGGVTTSVRSQGNKPAPKPAPKPEAPKPAPKPEAPKSAPVVPQGMDIMVQSKNLKIFDEPVFKKIKNPSAASTADLQAAVNRIKLEQEFKRLTASPPTKRQRFRAATGRVLSSALETQGKRAANIVIGGQVDNFLEGFGLKAKGKNKSKNPPKAQAPQKAIEAPKKKKK